MSHRRAKRLRKILDVRHRANELEPLGIHFVLNQSFPGHGHNVINPIRYTEGSVRPQYKKSKKLHKENPPWKLPTLKQLHEGHW